MAKTQFTAHHQPRISPKQLLGAVLALVLFFLLLSSVIGLAKKYFAVRTRNQELVGETKTLQQNEAELTATNAYLSSPQGEEASLREQYNYVKPGEGMIVISPAPSDAPAPVPQSIFSRWWNEIFH